MSEAAALFDIDGVTLRRGTETILEDVTFQVHSGDFLALIGPNGSGKTTLIRMMLGLIPPTSGKITVMGRPVGDFSEWSRVGYVPQKAAVMDPLFPASVREVVAMGVLPHKRWPRFLRAADHSVIRTALDLVDMGDFADRRVGELSGGQQQRVFIARAMASQPDVLLLDEPTTGVDASTQERFYDTLDLINRERGITLVLVTHDLGVITKHVNKVACLNQRLVFHGSHDEFCHSGQAGALLGGESHLICHHH